MQYLAQEKGKISNIKKKKKTHPRRHWVKVGSSKSLEMLKHKCIHSVNMYVPSSVPGADDSVAKKVPTLLKLTF